MNHPTNEYAEQLIRQISTINLAPVTDIRPWFPTSSTEITFRVTTQEREVFYISFRADIKPPLATEHSTMLLIDALVLVAQKYSDEQGWIISGQHGRIMSAPAHSGSYYYAWDASGTRIIGDPRLEVALSALLERRPAGARDEHWKIEPCTQET